LKAHDSDWIEGLPNTGNLNAHLRKAWNAEEAFQYLNNIGPAWENGGFNGEDRWLNINVYSEYEHEKRQFEMETGVYGSYDNL